MRILSNFHDYYDVGMGAGDFDDSLVYRRYKEQVEARHIPIMRQQYYERRNCPLEYRWALIGFCGKTYPVWEFNLTDRIGLQTKEARATRKFCYSVSDMDAWVRQHLRERDQEQWFAKEYDRKRSWPWSMRRHHFADYWERVFPERERDKHLDLFEKHHTPVWVRDTVPSRDHPNEGWNNRTVINACLKDYEFFRVFDPYLAFQEVSMFLGNMAMPEKPIPKMSDEDMAFIKGFDKHSFRKDPSPKKRKK